MPPVEFSANLRAAEFPFSYRHAGRSVLIPAPEDGSSYELPQLLFCENVLPFANGLFSVGYTQQVPQLAPGNTEFDRAFVIRDADENNYVFVPAAGKNYVFNATVGTWASISPFVSVGSYPITKAYVDGRTLICYGTERVIEYNVGTALFDTRVLTLPAGYTIADIRGICGAQNYLIAFTPTEILWSTATNILDLADTNLGAGKQTPQDLKGPITGISPTAGGFVIHTTRNSVGATFTNNAAQPFAYKEVKSSGGVESIEQASGDANEAVVYTWGSGGLQQMTLANADGIFPALTDFLVGRVYEEWDPINNAVVETEIAGSFKIKLNFVANRYLVVSYGQLTGHYSAAFIFDVLLKRWGKVKIEHTDSFVYPYPAIVGDLDYIDLLGGYVDLGADTDYVDLGVGVTVTYPPKSGIAFLQKDGTVYTLDMSFAATSTIGVALFGHFQHRRGVEPTLLGVEFEGLNMASAPVVKVLSSSTGFRRSKLTVPVLKASGSRYAKYGCRVTAKNHDIVVLADFALSTALLTVKNHGIR